MMSVEVARQVDVGLSNIPRRRFEAPGDIQLVTWQKIVKPVAVARRGQVGELVVRVAPPRRQTQGAAAVRERALDSLSKGKVASRGDTVTAEDSSGHRMAMSGSSQRSPRVSRSRAQIRSG